MSPPSAFRISRFREAIPNGGIAARAEFVSATWPTAVKDPGASLSPGVRHSRGRCRRSRRSGTRSRTDDAVDGVDPRCDRNAVRQIVTLVGQLRGSLLGMTGFIMVRAAIKCGNTVPAASPTARLSKRARRRTRPPRSAPTWPCLPGTCRARRWPGGRTGGRARSYRRARPSTEQADSVGEVSSEAARRRSPHARRRGPHRCRGRRRG